MSGSIPSPSSILIAHYYTEFAKEEEEPPKLRKVQEYFKCTTCPFKEKFIYFGKQPPNMKYFMYTERFYVMVDPFVPPNKNEYLILGTHCKICGKMVCRDTACSFYFDGTYCIKCAKENISKFPEAIQDKLNKISVS